MSIENIASQKSFGGWHKRYRHHSSTLNCDMVFAVYLPPQIEAGKKLPVLYWLSGLSCTDENFIQKAGAHQFAAELMAFEVPAIGPLNLNGATLHQFGGFAFSVSPRRGGRPPELDDGEVLEWIGRFLARIHTVGARKPFVARPALNVQTFAEEPMQWLLGHDMVPLDVQSAWTRGVEQAIAAIRKYDTLNAETKGNGDIRVLRLHGDCHPGNILWTPADAAPDLGPGPHFVDLDDARTGPAVQDFWMLLSGDRQQRQRQLGALVDGYEQFREFDRAELALIEPLRTLRLIHYSAWLARRWTDPTFPANFPWFGSSDYWQGQVQMLEEQLEAMEEPPLIV